MVGRPINQNRVNAEVFGEKTYRGSTHGCGTNERYVRGHGCVYCARTKALAQRQALREKQAVNDSENKALDSAAAPVYPEPWD